MPRPLQEVMPQAYHSLAALVRNHEPYQELEERCRARGMQPIVRGAYQFSPDLDTTVQRAFVFGMTLFPGERLPLPLEELPLHGPGRIFEEGRRSVRYGSSFTPHNALLIRDHPRRRLMGAMAADGLYHGTWDVADLRGPAVLAPVTPIFTGHPSQIE